MDRKDLKIKALLERISSLTSDYEERIADLRVDLTVYSQELTKVQDENKRLLERPDETDETTEEADASE